MKIYNVRVGIQHRPHTIKSFTGINAAHDFYNQHHPDSQKELNEKDTINTTHYRIILKNES